MTMTLSSPDSSAMLELVTEKLEPVSGSGEWSDDLLTYTFTPAELLGVQERYRSRMSWCDGSRSVSFLTGDPDDIPPDPSVIEGRTFYTDLDDGNWTQPPGLGTLIASGDMIGMLLEVVDIRKSEETVSLQIGFTDIKTAKQDFCAVTVDALADYSLSPWFSYSVSALELAYVDYGIPMRDVRVQGKLAYSGEAIEGISVLATVDARELLDLFDALLSIDDADEVCDLLAAFGGGCEKCPDGELYCSPVEVEDLSGRWMPDPVEEVEQANCHEDCPTSNANPDCDL
jgi:hypothetical protein